MMTVYEHKEFKYSIPGRGEKKVYLISALEGDTGVFIAFDSYENDPDQRDIPSLTNSVKHLYDTLRSKSQEGAKIIIVEASQQPDGTTMCSKVQFADGTPSWVFLGSYPTPLDEENLIEVIAKAKGEPIA